MGDDVLKFKMDQLKAINEAQRTAIAADNSTFNSQFKKQLLRDQLSNSSSERGLRRMEKVDKFITIIRNIFSTLFGWLFRGDFPLAHYIALFIVIMFMFGAFRYTRDTNRTKPNKRVQESSNRFIRGIRRIIDWFKGFLNKYFGWLIPNSYRLNLLTNLLTPFGSTKINGIPRTVQEGGRCNHLKWKEESAQCRNVVQPQNIQWIMDVDKMPEFNDMPTELTKILSKDGKHLVVKIPYGKTGIHYMPDCSKMTFADGSKANLFYQKDIKDELCRFVEKKSTLYNTEEKRSKNATNVYELCPK